MRYTLSQYGDYYDATAAHALDEFEEGDAELLPPISSSILNGCPACPYCESPGAGMCSCGTLLCASSNTDGPVTCPGCGSQLGIADGGSFDIRRSQG